VLEGDGKTMRHIKLATQADLNRPFIRRYIRTAMEHAVPAGTQGTGRTIVKISKKRS
jgi:hypothetical protein